MKRLTSLTTILLGMIMAATSVVAGSSHESTAEEPTGTPGAVEPPAPFTGLRNYRYCEFVPEVRDGRTITSYFYNTLGLNDCPEDLWQAEDEDALIEEWDAETVQFNGPRYWVIDELQGSGESVTGDVQDFGGIEAELRATIETQLSEATAGQVLYQENEVQRDTVYTYYAGESVYELVSPDGDVYIMQPYSQIVDPDLTIEDLSTLGDQLSPPEGWTYGIRTLEEDFLLETTGLAYVINDDFLNAYQRTTS